MIRIYTLSDPRNDDVFYVGASVHNEKSLLSRHTCPYFAGIRKELFELQLKPVIHFIDSTFSVTEAAHLEEYWHDQFRAWGFHLDNVTANKFRGYNGSRLKTDRIVNLQLQIKKVS